MDRRTHCVNPLAHENPNTSASFVLVVNKNRNIPVNAVDTAIVIFLPPIANLFFPSPRSFRVQSTTRHAMMDPGIPQTEMMA